jgi:predicted RNase H-like HicB family nuclease
MDGDRLKCARMLLDAGAVGIEEHIALASVLIWLQLDALLVSTLSYRIRLLETEEGWSVSCLDLPGCHSQGETREEALRNIREAVGLWLEVEAEEAGVKQVETLELVF